MFQAFLQIRADGAKEAVWECVMDCGQRIATAVVAAEGPTTLFIRSMRVPSKVYAVMMHQEIKMYFKKEGFKTLRYSAGPGIVSEEIR